MTAPDFAQAHAQARIALGDAVANIASRQWAKVDTNRIGESWLGLLPRLLVALVGGQQAAAGQAEPYAAASSAWSGLADLASSAIAAAGFAGAAADGRDLISLLFQPVITALAAIGKGAPVSQAMAAGAASLDTIVRTEVADAGRTADQVAMIARPNVDGYIRVVVGDSCSRCIILAGRWYPVSEWFERHPNCDCIQLPAKQAEAAGLIQDPREIYEGLTAKQRAEAGWSEADQFAIDEGSDIVQVTNVRRGGVYTAGGKQYTTEGTTRAGIYGGYDIDPETGKATRRPRGARRKAPRLTPQQIFDDAQDRDEAIRLLRENGYLLGSPVPQRAEPRAEAPQSPRTDVPAAIVTQPASLVAEPVRPASGVPEPAKLFHLSLAGIEDLALAVHNGSPERERRALTGGVSAVTELVTLRDGTRVVHKQGGVPTAEHTASMIGNALGLPVPRVYRDSERSVYMDYVSDAEPANVVSKRMHDDGNRVEWEDLLARAKQSEAGILTGLLDVLVANVDRNSGNWMLTQDGDIVPIDHGHASPPGSDLGFGRPNPQPLDAGGLFARKHFTDRSQWTPNPLTPRDVVSIREALEALGPAFDHIGQMFRLRYALAVLDAIEPHATGERDVFVKGGQ